MPFTKEKQAVYAVAMLRRLQVRVKGQIDDICATGETSLILDKILPSISKLPLYEVKAWVVQSINVKYSEPDARRRRRELTDEVERIAADQAGENERKHLMIQVLIDNCGRLQALALVKRVRKQAKVNPTGQHEVGSATGIQPATGLTGAPVDPDAEESQSEDEDGCQNTDGSDGDLA
jgi:hypothetical protein